MDFRLPELGEGVYEAELVGWQVKPGDRVKRGQNLMEVLTDKATMEVPAPFTGIVTSLNAAPGQTIKVGQPVLAYDSASGIETAPPRGNDVPKVEPAKPAPPVRSSSPPAPRPENSAHRSSAAVKVAAAPSVRLMARQLGIDLATIRGSGPGGRILVDDLSRQVRAAPAAAKAESEEPERDYGKPGTRIKLQGIRRKIAEHMVHAKKTIPHYGYIDECDATELVRLRQTLKDDFAANGIKLTYLAFIVKAAAQALKEVPIVNASLDEAAGEIVLHDRYNIGVAVAAPSGLIVPVVHDADRKDLIEVAREIERLSAAARTGKVRLEDLRGGTFTISSVGGIGGLISTPIIHHPESAILGLGNIVKRPVYDAAGNLRPADLMYLSFSFDHRIIDGAVGAAFGNAVIRQIQKPARLLMPAKWG